MDEMKLASEYKRRFNQEIAPYISTFGYNEPFMISDPNFKIISNLDFSDFSLSDLHLNSNIEHIRFKNCRFHNLINKGLMINMEFIECRFNDIDLYEVSIGITFLNCSIGKFTISNSEITDAISVKNTNNKDKVIGTLEIDSSAFKNNFTISNIEIHFLTINDTDFEGMFDFNNVLVHDECSFEEIKFKDLALFDECIFNAEVVFKYVVFEGFSHFRDSAFNDGLDLDYSSSKQEMNFHGVKGLEKNSSKNNTSQETYRIIKNQFEKLNNKIEANKYHALELHQRKKELEKNKWQNFSEYVVFKIHGISSNHSTSWFRALLWIIFVGSLTIFLVHFEIVKDLFFHPYHFKIEYIFKICNEFWQYINITNLEKLKDKPFIFFLNKVSLGYLYYQFLMSVRKDTRK